jgi:prepilin-type N-terminal cleavage/methylation domain-containing protein
MGGLFEDAGETDLATLAGGVARVGDRAAGNRRRGRRGFTLLELLITLSVTTIGLIGLLALHLSITRGNDGASRAAEAEQITSAALESLRAQSVANMLTTIGNTPTSTVLGRNGLPYNVTQSSTVLTQVSTSLILVRVQTTWTEAGAAFGSGSGSAAPLNHAIALEVIRTVEDQL